MSSWRRHGHAEHDAAPHGDAAERRGGPDVDPALVGGGDQGARRSAIHRTTGVRAKVVTDGHGEHEHVGLGHRVEIVAHVPVGARTRLASLPGR